MLRRLLKLISTSLRYKLLVLVLLPIFLIMPVILVLSAYWIAEFSNQQLYMKVNTDLAVAHDAFMRQQKDYLASMGRLAESYTFRNSLYLKDGDSLRLEIDELRDEGFDYLHLIDLQGNRLYEKGEHADYHVKASPLLISAGQGQPSHGVEIFDQAALLNESPQLAQKVRMTLIDTPHAMPIDKTVEDRGMLLRMVYPVYGSTDQVVALLDGGVLLNRNFGFVDTLRDLVYAPGSLVEGSIGTVTVFLDDVRITTNVPIRPGERALATRVSKEVREKVLHRGEKWIDRAFVVNDWYISSYEPIIDVHGERIGILYAGFLEQPFRQQSVNALFVLFGVFVIVMLVSIPVALGGARSIFRPIEEMSRVVKATQDGRQLRIGDIKSRDEIGMLASHVDIMLDEIQERNEQLINASLELEKKVRERTQELQEKNEDLLRNISLLNETRKQLVLAEKLASIGELTAGIAHEINNPTAVILGNMELLISELGDKVEPVKTEAELVLEQVYRIRKITQNLLKYSRTIESSGQLDTIDVNQLIEDTLPLVRYEMESSGCQIGVKNYSSHYIQIHRQELQQVLINLLVNACQAMEGQAGEIVIETKNWEDKGVVISVIDRGKGIQEEQLDNVFDPFFTTKSSGTGLGLSVSYGIVQHYGGNITVRSAGEGEGSRFSVWLLCEPEIKTAAEPVSVRAQ